MTCRDSPSKEEIDNHEKIIDVLCSTDPEVHTQCPSYTVKLLSSKMALSPIRAVKKHLYILYVSPIPLCARSQNSLFL